MPDLPSAAVYGLINAEVGAVLDDLLRSGGLKDPVVGDVEVVASGISMTGFSKAIRKATPELSECTDEVLASVGYSADEIADMRKKGAI